MGNNQTAAGRKLWFEFLRAHPVKFRRQGPIRSHILNFYVPSLKLCIELDGRSHDEQAVAESDAERTRQFAALGVQVVRFSNAEGSGQFGGVCAAIAAPGRGEAPF
ncbi:endonuclease domain-containing protein [Deinococcus apachensis]|uniref:endonuclease domain-containing protein n=1 Tax=Deinococcus apachensis TaxID=309886 RepID=UPI00146CB506|nr:endonuclease domain-containing protein [Deinococcus apachensis]